MSVKGPIGGPTHIPEGEEKFFGVQEKEPKVKKGHTHHKKAVTVKDKDYYRAKATEEIKTDMMKNTGWGEKKLERVLTNPKARQEFNESVEELAKELETEAKEKSLERKEKIEIKHAEGGKLKSRGEKRTGKEKTPKDVKIVFEQIETRSKKLPKEKALRGGDILLIDAGERPRGRKMVGSQHPFGTERGERKEFDLRTSRDPRFTILQFSFVKLKPHDVIVRDDSTGGFRVIDRRSQGWERTAIENGVKDILKALNQGIRDPSVSRADIHSLCKSLDGNKSFHLELKRNPELKAKFDKIEKRSSEHLVKKAEKEFSHSTNIDTNNLKKAVEEAGLKGNVRTNDALEVLVDHQETFETLVDNSGMQKKTAELPGEVVSMKQFLSTCTKQLDEKSEQYKSYSKNPEETVKLVIISLLASKNEVTNMTVIRNFNESNNLETMELYHTFMKTTDKLIDGFCRENIVEVGRIEREASEEFSILAYARNSVIHEELSKIPGFEDFVSDRLQINYLIFEARGKQGLYPEDMKLVMESVAEFEEKYADLAEKHQSQLDKLRRKIPPPIDQFDVHGKRTDEKYQQMLTTAFKDVPKAKALIKTYTETNDDKQREEAQDKLVTMGIQKYGLPSRIVGYGAEESESGVSI